MKLSCSSSLLSVLLAVFVIVVGVSCQNTTTTILPQNSTTTTISNTTTTSTSTSTTTTVLVSPTTASTSTTVEASNNSTTTNAATTGTSTANPTTISSSSLTTTTSTSSTTATPSTTTTTTTSPNFATTTLGSETITYFELIFPFSSPIIPTYFSHPSSDESLFRNQVRNLFLQEFLVTTKSSSSSASTSLSETEVQEIVPKIFSKQYGDDSSSSSSTSSLNYYSVIFSFASVWNGSPWDEKSLRAAKILKNYLRYNNNDGVDINSGLTTSRNRIATYFSASLFGEKVLNLNQEYFPGASADLQTSYSSSYGQGRSISGVVDFSLNFDTKTSRENDLDEDEIAAIIGGVCGGSAVLVAILSIVVISYCQCCDGEEAKKRQEQENKRRRRRIFATRGQADDDDPFNLKKDHNTHTGIQSQENSLSSPFSALRQQQQPLSSLSSANHEYSRESFANRKMSEYHRFAEDRYHSTHHGSKNNRNEIIFGSTAKMNHYDQMKWKQNYNGNPNSKMSNRKNNPLSSSSSSSPPPPARLNFARFKKNSEDEVIVGHEGRKNHQNKSKTDKNQQNQRQQTWKDAEDL